MDPMTHHPELNLDGIPGPTHGFAGLSHGNLASQSSKANTSNPRAAMLQGLEKMRLVASLGVPQAVLPPHDRPHLPTLRRLGFTGTDADVLEKAWKADPGLLTAASSASAMWTANAATVSPSADALDGVLHITPANLAYQFHRSLEPAQTARTLRLIFPRAAHHDPLPTHASLGDEGAANHVRLGGDGPGLQLFVHGDPPTPTRRAGTLSPRKYPARQTLRASRSVARLNAVREGAAVFLQQHPAAIDAGAFHNDVVCVGSADVLLMHERAFAQPPDDIRRLTAPHGVTVLAVADAELSLDDAVSTYLFNSQLVPLPDGSLALIAPTNVRDHPRARATAERLVAAGTRLKDLHYVDLRQSMKNGGGPACLRLRVPLTATELADVHPGVLFTDTLSDRLADWATRRYRTELTARDLADPLLLRESRDALDELSRILALPGLYDAGRD